MSEVPPRLIRAIQNAGINVQPSHAAFQQVAREVWDIVEEQADAVQRVIGGSRDRIVDLLLDTVGCVSLSAHYEIAGPQRIANSVMVFGDAVRGRAAELITGHNCDVSGEAEAPPPRVHEYKPIRRPKGRKWC